MIYSVISLIDRQKEEELERLRQAEIERLEREAEAAAIAEMEELDAQLKVKCFCTFCSLLIWSCRAASATVLCRCRVDGMALTAHVDYVGQCHNTFHTTTWIFVIP